MQKIFFFIIGICVISLIGCGSNSKTSREFPSNTAISTLTTSDTSLEEAAVEEEIPVDYEEKISLPSCDKENTQVAFITKSSDWSIVNRKDKRIFCVQPGDYSDVDQVVLQTSGTESERRYILLDNGSAKHPAQLSDSTLAKVGFSFKNTQFWVIDRMAYWERNDSFIPITFTNSDNNIINRYFIHDVKGGGVVFYPDSDYNVVQNSRIERIQIYNYMDRAAIEINNGTNDNVAVTNNRIVHNELVNYVDGIQLVKTGSSNQTYVNYEGTIIDHNQIYIDSTVYTDCKGHPNVHGECAYAENAIDLKSGSENPNNPLIISYNTMWGYKKADSIDWTKYQNKSDLSDLGVVVPMHFNVKNVVFHKNIFFNSMFGVVCDGEKYGYAAQNIQITENIFYNILSTAIYGIDIDRMTVDKNLFKHIAYGIDEKGSNTYNSVYFNQSHRIQFTNNTIVDAYRDARFYVKESDYQGMATDFFTFLKNTYFNAKVSIGNNPYEQSLAIVDTTATILRQSQEDPTKNYQDLTIITDQYSNESKEISLPKVLP